jgi:hypothetical protein
LIAARAIFSVRVPRLASNCGHVRHEEDNASTIAIAGRPVVARGSDMSVGYPREVSNAAIACFWAATVLASWVLVGLVVAGIWVLVT